MGPIFNYGDRDFWPGRQHFGQSFSPFWTWLEGG